MEKEKYQPSEEEIKKAEEMMTARERSDSMAREFITERDKKIEAKWLEKEVQEVVRQFTCNYPIEIIQDNKTPESYIWNSRRVLRNTIQIIIENLEKLGITKKEHKGFDARKAGGIYTLETKGKYQEFIQALNEIVVQYDRLFDGSEEIYYDKHKNSAL